MRRICLAAGLCLAVVLSSVGVLVAPQPASAASAPSAPGVATAVASNGAAVVSWGPPASDGGSPITGYVVTPYRDGTAEPAQTFTSSARTQTVTGLVNGSPYGFRVVAVNAEGIGPVSGLNPFLAVVVGAPGTPTDVTAVAGAQSAEVSWTPPVDNGSPITGYTIAITAPGQSLLSAQTITVPGPVAQATVSIPAGTERLFTVRAVNSRGTGVGGRSNTVSASPSAPTSPGVVTAVAGVQTATVTWSTPVANGGSPIQGYVVTPSRDGVTLDPVSFASTALSQDLTTLAPGSYTFTVAAYNAVGTSVPSSPSASVQVASSAMPGAPGPARPLPLAGAAVVTWAAPASDGGSPITGYVVTPFNEETAEAPQTFLSPSRTQTVTGLTNGRFYRFRVSAINANGIGLQSSFPGTYLGTFVGSPVAPPSVTASAGQRSADVSWAVPADNGSPITGYRLAIATPGQSGFASRFLEVGPGVTSFTVGELTPSVTTTITVAARNARGAGPGRAAAPVVPQAAPPGQPGSVNATGGVESATLGWNLPANDGGLPIIGYDVTPYRDGVALATVSFASTQRSQTLSGLPAGVYAFTVAARNAVGAGPASMASAPVQVSAVGAPSAPGTATATPGNGAAEVTWSAPSSVGGSPVLGYVVVPYSDGIAEASQTFMSTTRTQTLTGLANGGYYRFRVAAINAAGVGQFSALPNSFFGITVGAPLAPASAAATAGTGQALVSWEPPTTDNGSPVTSYRIKVTLPGESLLFARTIFVSSNATSTTISDLVRGAAYTFTINAVNARGTGAPVTAGPVTPT